MKSLSAHVTLSFEENPIFPNTHNTTDLPLCIATSCHAKSHVYEMIIVVFRIWLFPRRWKKKEGEFSGALFAPLCDILCSLWSLVWIKCDYKIIHFRQFLFHSNYDKCVSGITNIYLSKSLELRELNFYWFDKLNQNYQTLSLVWFRAFNSYMVIHEELYILLSRMRGDYYGECQIKI